ncbi:MAG TPA: methylated-DNA--[protein]-cysteine S-methyltransferase [Candidatus Limnocylindrales bacterium]|nr:methylated-DNA--[protein]-cysteine S-methyltransferase [Candidatus Limnocylindrales bacterium]
MPDRVASFASLDTPIGRLWLSGTDTGLLVLTRADAPQTLLAELRRRRWAAVADPSSLAQPLAALEAYFGGSPGSLRLPLDLRRLPRFDAAVYRAAMEIPYGETISYGELAAMAGSPRAARAVGGAMSRCPLFPVVPCHRVIHADGSITGWGPDLWVKRWLLDLEGKVERRLAPGHGYS